MNWLVYAVVAWVMFGLELGLKDGLQLGATGIAPSFVVVLLVVVAVSAPRQTALWAALVTGVLLDLTHKSPAPAGIRPVIILGPYTLGCLLAAYTVLTTRAMVFRRNVITIAFLSLLAGVMMHIVVTAIFAVRQWYDRDFIQINALIELRNGLADALYTALLAMLVAPGLLFLSPLLGFPQAQGRDRGRRR